MVYVRQEYKALIQLYQDLHVTRCCRQSIGLFGWHKLPIVSMVYVSRVDQNVFHYEVFTLSGRRTTNDIYQLTI